MRLSLVPAPKGTPARPPVAWLFPSADPADVIGHLACQGGDLAAARVTRLPVGLFVRPAESTPFPPTAPAIPFGRLAGDVFAPIDAVPDAAVSADEWEELFPAGWCYVWHPTAGLFATDPEEEVPATELLVPPPVDRPGRGRALPGTAFNGRILSLLPERPPTLADVWSEAAAEIGAESPSLRALPRMPGEWRWPGLGGPWLPRVRAAAIAILSLALVAAMAAWVRTLWNAPRLVDPGGGPSGEAVGAMLLILLILGAAVGLATLARGVEEGGRESERSGFDRAWVVFSVGLLVVVLWQVAASRGAVVLPLLVGLGSLLVPFGFLLLLTWLCGEREGATPVPAEGRPGQGSAGRSGAAVRGTRSTPSWGSPSRWLLAWQARLARAFESRHEREIRRLRWLLDHDPDLGLRFAVPLVGDPGRGVPLPAEGLAEQRVDYGARSDGVAAFLVASAEHRAALARRYRELANREIALGRHRRAAYVFAHLLGDHAAAARALVDGGHFREAAVLYRSKLGMPREAARALEDGGLLSEAIALYDVLGDHEKVGDLARLLGQEEEAQAAFRRAVSNRCDAGNPIDAARILDTKLGDADQAIATLVDGWTHAVQARACAAEVFGHLGRLGRHAEARDFVRRLVDDGRGDDRRAATFFQVVPDVVRGYPDAATRRLIADQTRLLAAEVLPWTPADSLGPVMAALRVLEPGDRLLQRDTRRFGREREPKRPSRRRGHVIRIGRAPLPERRWSTLVGAGATVFAAGRIGRQLAVARCEPDGEVRVATDVEWSAGQAAGDSETPDRVMLAVSRRLGRAVIQSQWGLAVSAQETLPASEGGGTLRIGGHPALAGQGGLPLVAGMAFTESSVFDLLRLRSGRGGEQEWIRERYDAATDTLLGTWTIPGVELPHESNAPLAATLFHGDRLYAEGDGVLVVHDVTDGIRWLPLMGPVQSLAASGTGAWMRLVVTYVAGATVRWGDDESDPSDFFGKDLVCPRCCLLPGDLLVAAAKGTLEVYDLSRRKAVLVASHGMTEFEPVAIEPLVLRDRPHAFAILDADGSVTTYGVDR